MILKKQLLNQDNLNGAFLSKLATGEQTIASNLKLAGKLTLKEGGSFLSDNENAGYMQIDAQGNHVALYDGVNDQKLSVYSFNGTKGVYLTSFGTANYGLIETIGLDHLEINTVGNKYTKFGGEVRVNNNMHVGKGAAIFTQVGNRAYLSIRGTGSTTNGDTVGILELSDSASDVDGRHLGLIQSTDYLSTAADKRAAGIAFWNDGTTANNRGGAITFLTKGDGVSGWGEKMRIRHNGYVDLQNRLTFPNNTNTGFSNKAETAWLIPNDVSGNFWFHAVQGVYMDGTVHYMRNQSGATEWFAFNNLGMTLPVGGAIFGRYMGSPLMQDHGNGNVTLSSSGGDLFVGYVNTVNVRFERPVRLDVNPNARLVLPVGTNKYAT